LFALRGDRQVFANGIWALSLMSAVLLVAVGGNTLTLIPLFAIGVFTGFTLSQAGLVRHWLRARPARWRYRMVLNAAGATATGIATVVFLATKFLAGAWVVVIAVPLFIAMFVRIHSYYQRAGSVLGLDALPPRPHGKPCTVIVPVTQVSLLTEYVISRALSISPHVLAVTVGLESEQDDQRIAELRRQWREWNPGVPLSVLRTDFPSVAGPLVSFVNQQREASDYQVVVLIPSLLPSRWRYRILHNQLDLVLTNALRDCQGVVVARVPMVIETGRSLPNQALPDRGTI
ncbi:MAG: amino acid permease, partial [Mycobacteriales bacterium]